MLILKLNEYICWLIVERSLEDCSYRTIARQLNISKTSISRIFLHFKKYGCVEKRLPSLGRSRILGVDDI
ncbi:12623_t:CDS:1, partial [Funneliformis geosporum]